MNQKAISLVILACVTSTLLFGCKKTEQTTTNNEKVSTAVADPTGTSLPIVSKPVTLKVWSPLIGDATKAGVKTLNDNEAYKELEKRTGIHIEWLHPTFGQEQENFNLIIASQDYPDIFISQMYQAGIDKAIQDGVYLKLNDYIDKYAPNYKKVRETSDNVRKLTATDSGNLGAIYQVTVPDQGPWYGPAVRQDWLDELGLKTPVTFDDWYTMLKAFKEKKNAAAPLWIYNKSVDPFDNLIAGYGVGQRFYNVNGTAKYGPIEAGYKEYITMLNKWYKEGLIDKDYYSKKDIFAPSNMVDTGKSGAFTDAYTMFPIHAMVSGDKKMNIVAVPNPVKSTGDKLHLRQYNFNVGAASAISTSCKDPIAAVKWLDYMFTDEGSLLGNYGIKDKSYNLVDGKPKQTETITKNPDGLTSLQASTKYLMISQPMKYYWQRGDVSLPKNSTDAINTIWPSNDDGVWTMPPVTTTADEGANFSRIMGDIDTYVGEMTTKFIIGAEPLSKYDDFVKKINDMKIADVIKIQQAALDRYNKRK